MVETIIRQYEFLLADPKNDHDYTEGNETGGYLVYGTFSEMQKRLSDTFGKSILPFKEHFGDSTSVWHIDDCTIDYSAQRDKEIPGNPLCFGYLSVVGRTENVDMVNAKLINSFPRIDDLVTNKKY